MDAEIKRRWVEALRSGNYKQERKALIHKAHTPNGRDRYSYCCLGVLCAVLDPERIERAKFDENGNIFWNQLDLVDIEGEEPEVDDSQLLPRWAQKMAGLGEDPTVQYCSNEHSCLSGLNDELLSFTEIADLIEAQL